MQTSYGFSGLLCFSKTNTNSHSHSAPALHLTTRAEARVGGNSCRQKSFRATRTSSWMLTGIVKCFKAHPMPTQTCQNMPKHATAMFMLVNAQNCQGLCKTQFTQKFPQRSNLTVARESLRANKRSPTFHSLGICARFAGMLSLVSEPRVHLLGSGSIVRRNRIREETTQCGQHSCLL